MNASTTLSQNTNEDVFVTATAICPTGKVVLGGGGEINTSNTAIRSQVLMFRTFPVMAGTRWQATAVIISGFSGQSVTITSYAIWGVVN